MQKTNEKKNDISEKEISFLKHISTEKTYKEIADEMGISERQTEYIRNCFFERYNIKSRTALAMLAMEKGLII